VCAVYHLELRQFPHKTARFNLSEQQVQAVLVPWALERVVDVGERKWTPQQATITVLEGPELETSALSMGRGWRSAERQGADVTQRMLEAARALAASAPPVAASQGTPAAAHPVLPGPGDAGGRLADPLALGVQLATLLGADASALLQAWREAAGDNPGLAPSESLAIAERRIAGGPGD
jgi:hypothetical protein